MNLDQDYEMVLGEDQEDLSAHSPTSMGSPAFLNLQLEAAMTFHLSSKGTLSCGKKTAGAVLRAGLRRGAPDSLRGMALECYLWIVYGPDETDRRLLRGDGFVLDKEKKRVRAYFIPLAGWHPQVKAFALEAEVTYLVPGLGWCRQVVNSGGCQVL